MIRRVTFDLIGLPPTPEEIDAFLHDESADAYEKLVDRLLASPHYGEQWARHWLDVVRFGENEGFEHNRPRPNAWRYRDWVIDALNSDMPYDRFVREQIAGDVLAPNDPMAVTATGYLVCGSYDSLGMGKGSEAMIELTAPGLRRKSSGKSRPDFPGADRQLRTLSRPQIRSNPTDGILSACRRPGRSRCWRARICRKS